MNYHTDGKGPGEGYKMDPLRDAICFRGPFVTPGYFRAPYLTKEATNDDSWFHNGGVGELTPFVFGHIIRLVYTAN